MHTFCAMAAAPGDYLNNMLGKLKLILANKKHSFNRGAQVAITDLMTVSSDMFVEAMKNFPKKTLVVKHPTHRQLGDYIKTVSSGFESLQEKGYRQGDEFLGHQQGQGGRTLRQKS